MNLWNNLEFWRMDFGINNLVFPIYFTTNNIPTIISRQSQAKPSPRQQSSSTPVPLHPGRLTVNIYEIFKIVINV